MDIDKMDISPELREKAKECNSPEEILALAKKEGIKLTEEQLESITGGSAWSGAKEYSVTCNICGTKTIIDDPDNPPTWCPSCGRRFYYG